MRFGIEILIRKYAPGERCRHDARPTYAFTEHGAIMAATGLGRAAGIPGREDRIPGLPYDTFSRDKRTQLRRVFEALRELTVPPEPAKRPIGFVTHQEKKAKPLDGKAHARKKAGWSSWRPPAQITTDCR
jgi:hypothetical protein